MVKDIAQLLKENERLTFQKGELYQKLNEANEVIESIRKGNIDAVFTANKQTAEVLVSKTSDQAYRKFIENMSEGVVTLHTDGMILYSNSSFAKMVDLPLENVTGKNIRDFIPIEHIGMFDHFFIADPRNNAKVELSILSHKGKRIHFIVSINALYLEGFVALNLVWTDVTDQKIAEEKLIILNEALEGAIEERIYSEAQVFLLNDKLTENNKILNEANIELSTFAHITSHDLQEPLRKIMTYCSILKNDYNDVIDQEGQGYINKMQSASSRLRKLINDILEYSELSLKKIKFKPTNLQSVLEEVLADLEIVITEKKAIITIEKGLPIIEANSTQMRQLFQNIISNSLKFIKAGIIPQINIIYKIVNGTEIKGIDKNLPDEQFCQLSITDNGIGFNPEYVDKIFTIFQRLNNISAYQGTGIGLAICKKIAEKHRGLIFAESNHNDGALFTIALPVHQTGNLEKPAL